MMLAVAIAATALLLGSTYLFYRWWDTSADYEHVRHRKLSLFIPAVFALALLTGLAWIETIRMEEFEPAWGATVFAFAFMGFGLHTVELWRRARIERLKKEEAESARFIRRIQEGDTGSFDETLRPPGDSTHSDH